MTLIVALECHEGLVMASESQSTLATQGQLTKASSSKLEILSHSIIWAGSGHVGTIQRVHAEIDKQGASIVREFAKGHEAGARELHKHVTGVQRQIAGEVLPSAGGTYETGFLFTGYSKDGPYILECDGKGAREWQHPNHFATIGSGDIFAVHAWRSIAHHDIPSLSLAQAQALLYRTIEDAIATAAFGLGGQVQVCIASPGVAPHVLDREEMKAVQDLVEIWKAQEVDVLKGLGPTSKAEPEPPAATTPPPSETHNAGA
jgi:20S proteasome alpha/beta subunit